MRSLWWTAKSSVSRTCSVRVPERLHDHRSCLGNITFRSACMATAHHEAYGPLARDQGVPVAVQFTRRLSHELPYFHQSTCSQCVLLRCNPSLIVYSDPHYKVGSSVAICLSAGITTTIETEGKTVVQFRNCLNEPDAFFGNAIQVVCYCSWYSATTTFTAARPVTEDTLTSRLSPRPTPGRS